MFSRSMARENSAAASSEMVRSISDVALSLPLARCSSESPSSVELRIALSPDIDIEFLLCRDESCEKRYSSRASEKDSEKWATALKNPTAKSVCMKFEA